MDLSFLFFVFGDSHPIMNIIFWFFIGGYLGFVISLPIFLRIDRYKVKQSPIDYTTGAKKEIKDIQDGLDKEKSEREGLNVNEKTISKWKKINKWGEKKKESEEDKRKQKNEDYEIR